MNYSAFDSIYQSTVYLFFTAEGGQSTTATGFFFQFAKCGIPCVITNKHAVQGNTSVVINFRDKKTRSVQMVIELNQNSVILHQDDKIDLAVILINKPTLVKCSNTEFDTFFLNEEMVLKKDELSSFSLIEDIIMLGCPAGIWDTTNLHALARKGITATPIGENFCGKEHFLLDIGSIGGSSGSPVFLFLKGHPKLAGIFCETHYHSEKISTDPNLFKKFPIGIGEAIYSYKLLDFKKYFKQE